MRAGQVGPAPARQARRAQPDALGYLDGISPFGRISNPYALMAYSVALAVIGIVLALLTHSGGRVFSVFFVALFAGIGACGVWVGVRRLRWRAEHIRVMGTPPVRRH